MTVEQLVKALSKIDWNKPIYMEISQRDDIPADYEWDSVCFGIGGIHEVEDYVMLLPEFYEEDKK